MRDSIVTQWHRVCDDNWSRAHVHLSYSLGYLIGCMFGGFISDRYSLLLNTSKLKYFL